MQGLGTAIKESVTQTVLRLSPILTLAVFLIFPSVSHAGDITLATSETGNYAIRVSSYSEIPFRTVIRQQFDYSCGSAALATMLRFHYGVQTNEADVFKAMYAVGDQDRIQKLGFSLLDMKKYLSSLGYEADGYRLTVEEIGHLDAPSIALVQINSYKHFVVVKGYIDGHVLVGDPALGLRMMSAEEFTKIWNGIAFVVREAPADIHPIFNDAGEWQKWTDAHPLTAAVITQPLAPLLRDLRVQYQIQPNQILPNPFQP
jgi:predicted double-glycine peptidase